jgi:regulation of enolase protein 1 (concanavalin A-like superfamily)
MPGDVRLRLERAGGVVRALCSGDGGEWHCVGETPFPAGRDLEVGLFSEGAVRPEIYPRTYGAGAEIVFKEFTLSAPA